MQQYVEKKWHLSSVIYVSVALACHVTERAEGFVAVPGTHHQKGNDVILITRAYEYIMKIMNIIKK